MQKNIVNIVIPMAGRGSRFAVNPEKYPMPKPFIPVHGKPMIQVVAENLAPKTREYRFIFICQNDHIRDYKLDTCLPSFCPGAKEVIVLGIDGVTDGMACTVLEARDYINNDEALMVAGSDQWIAIDVDDYLDYIDQQEADGMLMTMTVPDLDPKWSYAKSDDRGWVTETAEKNPISKDANIGIYNYAKGSDFIASVDEMMEKGDMFGTEYYIAPAYNYLISEGKKIVVYDTGLENEGVHGIGIPADLERFLADPISQRVK
jgi:NDP-sugar pyrophosphorylase family protein